MRPPKEIDRKLRNAARELAKRINTPDRATGYDGWPANGLHRPPKPSTGNSKWTHIASSSGWVATSGRRYGQWVQPVGIAGKAHGNPPHGFELSRNKIPQLTAEIAQELQADLGMPVVMSRLNTLGRRIEFIVDPMFPEQILIELYKNGVPR